MSPLGDSAVCVQRWNGSPLMKGAGLPGTPMVSSILPAGRAPAHRVVAVVGAIEIVVGVDVQPVRAMEDALAPGAQEIALAVEHHHGVLAAIEDVDLVLAVDGDGGRRP